jgi:hypothetical protein
MQAQTERGMDTIDKSSLTPDQIKTIRESIYNVVYSICWPVASLLIKDVLNGRKTLEFVKLNLFDFLQEAMNEDSRGNENYDATVAFNSIRYAQGNN